MTLSTEQLNQLVNEFATGQAAFGALLAHFRGELVQFGRLGLKADMPAADASDIAGDVAQKLLDRMGGLFHEGDVTAFRNWLWKAYKHAFLNEVRHESRVADWHAEAAALAPADSPSPSGATHERELTSALDTALASLPESDRLLYVLHFVHHWSYPQLSALLGANRSEDALRMRLNRLRLELFGHPALRDYRPPG